ncbi:Bifunctional protein Aas [Polystyrenella longa]|uniref:Bifunctional protein Aas n=1 Tax=Polystyrenella longa TaxID=2528007 RepID=A0A518CKY4_9PLAN|nr:acyl-[ACP]--phospholipid O-acyltransferase [Polystyrenella longa]QDU79844.1 Bifunctional protein Aas [Polystyrenella longa]
MNTVTVTEADDHRGSLRTQSYLGLWLTQFLGTINDNAFRWLAVPIAKMVYDESTALSLGLACFTIPYLLFATPAAYLADRYSKRSVIIGCKIAEILIMALGLFCIWLGSISGLFLVVFLMGMQSALFYPSKFGSLPEILKSDQLSKGNGLLGMATIVAAAVGFVLGMELSEKIGVDYENPVPISSLKIMPAALVLFTMAGLGLISSLFISKLPPADPERVLPNNPVKDTYQSLNQLFKSKALFRAALGSAFFWFLAALAQLNIDAYGTIQLQLDQTAVGPLLALLVIGVGVGSVLAGYWSGDHVELGISPLGALGIVFSSIVLYSIGALVDPSNALSTSYAYRWSCLCLLVLGLAAGLFNIPLESYIQHRSPDKSRGRILAAANFLCFTLTLFASGLFWVLREQLKLEPSTIFLLLGIATMPVAIYIFVLLPNATIRFAVWLVTHTIYKVRVWGRGNLPERGGALLVANHVTWLDGVFLMVTSSRPIRMIAYEDYVNKPWIKWVAKLFGVIPIKPEAGPKALITSLQQARQAIEQGELVCIFAEGQLTRTGQLQQFQGGVMHILKGTDAPVVPVYLDELWGSIFSYRGGRFLWKLPLRIRYPLSIKFGKPIEKPDSVHQIRQAVQDLGVELMEERKSRIMVPIRAFLRQCRSSLFRRKVADYSGNEATGAKLLIGSLIFKRLFRRKNIGMTENMVGVLLPPSVAAAVTNTALTMKHNVAVNLNYTLSEKDVNHCIEDCGIKHVLTSRRFLEKRPIEMNVELIFLEDLKEEISLADKAITFFQTYLVPIFLLERIHGLHKIEPDDILTVIFTSGSTGNPKGVMLTNYNIATNVDAAIQLLHFDKNDVLLGVLPYFHSFGYMATLWLVIASEPQAVYHFNPIDVNMIGKLCEKYGVSVIITTPTFLKRYLKRCTKEQFCRLDTVVTGAEKLPVELQTEFYEKFGVLATEGYGTTELSPLVSCNVPDHRSKLTSEVGTKIGTVGRAAPNISVKVVHPETREDLDAEQEGLLLVKGPNVMKGYLNQPEKTAEVIRDGWYETGDFARIHQDGFIEITGRQSRFSKIAGEMVPHIKIEQLLTNIVESPDDEEEEIVLAVTSIPDESKGERIIVVHRKLNKPTDEVLKSLGNCDIPNLWLPSRDSFLEVDQIPILGTGKLDLRSLKQLAIDHYSRVTA